MSMLYTIFASYTVSYLLVVVVDVVVAIAALSHEDDPLSDEAG